MCLSPEMDIDCKDNGKIIQRRMSTRGWKRLGSMSNQWKRDNQVSSRKGF